MNTMRTMTKISFRRVQGHVSYLTVLLALALFAQLVPGNATSALAYTTLQPAEILSMVLNGTAGTIIDVRENSDYCRGHIPCALNYPWTSGYLQSHFSELDPGSRYTVVCTSGIRSASASALLENQGFTDIYTMSSGMNAWSGASQPCGTECPPLYFPHIATSAPWQTEIAIINASDQAISGTLKAMSDAGQIVHIRTVLLPSRARREINVAAEFTNHTTIGYMIFTSNSAAVQGYTKFYIPGSYRAAIPAVKEVGTSNIYVSHIASNDDWSTGISLLNTTSSEKTLTITFSNGQSRNRTLAAKQHDAFLIRELFDNQPQPDIESAVISNADGIIGLELFGSLGWGTQLEGILLTDKTTSTIYYPHIGDSNWWTGIVAYNTSDLASTITVTPYTKDGSPLSPIIPDPIEGKGKYVDSVAALGLPAQTAWFRIDSTRPMTGFELFGTTNGNQLGAYSGGGGTGAKTGVFAKIEKSGWTGIAFVNTEAVAASVTLTAYNDDGTPLATKVLPVGGHAKVVDSPANIFAQDISNASYIAFTSDRNVVGFQLNGSADGTMLDGLPGM